MTIQIKMNDGKFRTIIGDELWEYPNLESLIFNLKKILEVKEQYGKINNY